MAGKRQVTGVPVTRKPVTDKDADSNAPPCCDADRTPSFNETTFRALEDARAGIGVTEYSDVVELFEKIGIEAWKTETKA